MLTRAFLSFGRLPARASWFETWFERKTLPAKLEPCHELALLAGQLDHVELVDLAALGLVPERRVLDRGQRRAC